MSGAHGLVRTMGSDELRNVIERLEGARLKVMKDPWLDADLQSALGALRRMADALEREEESWDC